jgi:HPt (histidine-containing phosphotransfer) domain-containing protein
VSDVVIPEINSVFDPKMLNDLQSVIGESQFEELLNSLITSTDEILGRLHIAIVQQNSIDIKNRAHELKGMAANFGLTELSSLSAAIEDYARKNDINAISKIGETLESAKDRAQKALEDWKS